MVYHIILNTIGYNLIERNRINDAIEVFKLNVKENPKSDDYFDSLGEGYFFAGKYDISKQNYLKTLELDSESSNAKKMIKQIEKLQQENN